MKRVSVLIAGRDCNGTPAQLRVTGETEGWEAYDLADTAKMIRYDVVEVNEIIIDEPHRTQITRLGGVFPGRVKVKSDG